jgi:hypothetical protein
MPRWSPVRTARPRRISSGKGAAIIIAIIVIGGLLTSTVVGVTYARARFGTEGAASCSSGCLPGLHSDKCR